jgi:hypothetical protein
MHSKGEKTLSQIHFEMPQGATQIEFFFKTWGYTVTSHTCRALAKVKKKLHCPMHAEDWV